MRAVAVFALAVVVAALAAACGSGSPTLATPSWARSALATDDADIVVALNVARLREDKIFYPAIRKVARRDDLDFLLGTSQIDAVASADDGEPRSWVVAVHGIDRAPRDEEVRRLGPSRRLASGTTEYKYQSGAMLVFPGSWVFAGGPALDRMRATPPASLGRIPMQDSAILEATVRARAFPRRAHVTRVAEGLVEGTIIILGVDRLAMIVRGRYVDSDKAARAEEESRAELDAIARRNVFAFAIVRELIEVDVRRSGDTLTWRVEAKQKLLDYVREYTDKDESASPRPPRPPPPDPPTYPGACAPGQRWDLDRRACVEGAR